MFFYYKKGDAQKPVIVKEDILMSTLRDFVDDKLDGASGGQA